MKKISFIEAGSPSAHIFSRFPIPRLGAVLLSTILKQRGYEARAFVEDLREPDWSFVEDSDLVCISTITSTATRAYKIGERLRGRGIPVVMGGAHPSFMPEEALQYSDFVIRGEGDHALPELVAWMEKGDRFAPPVPGVSYRDKGGRVVHNPGRDFITGLDEIPEPDFSVVHGWKRSNIHPLSTSRGCPFNCRFCSVIQMFGRKYRFKSVPAALNEIKHTALATNQRIFIVDDNFTANKTRTKELLKGMLAERVNARWTAQVRTDVASDPELLRLMADSGCDTTYIGFESINPKTLQAFNKKQELKDIIRCIEAVRAHGIHIHGMFVVGGDTDDVDTIRRTAEFAIRHQIDTIQFMMLTPLPGTPFFREMKESGRLLHTNWSTYDAHHAVFRPALITSRTLQIETLRAMGRFYSWRYILRHMATLNMRYTAIGLFGKRKINEALREVSAYLDSLRGADELYEYQGMGLSELASK